MGSLSIWHWIIVVRGRAAAVRPRQDFRADGRVAQGIKAFKKGMSEDERPAETPRPSR